MNQDQGAMREMPIYQCHKQVWALKIKSIEHLPNPDPGRSAAASYGAILTPEENGFHAFPVGAEFMTKHRPEVGGYYVVYKDGYRSYSPAKAFEEGYSPLSDTGPGQAAVCKGLKCETTSGKEHSPECIIEAAITQGWADSDAAREAAHQVFKIPKAVMPHIPSQRDLLELVIGAAKVLAESPQLSPRIAQGIREVLDALHPKVEVTLSLDASEKACSGKCGACASTAAPAPSTPSTSAVVLDPLMKMVEERANVAPRVTVKDIEAEIVSEFYFTGADGRAGAAVYERAARGLGCYPGDLPEKQIPLSLLTFCILVLKNGYTVVGQSAVASPANFDPEIGRGYARQDAIEKIWPLLGFRLRDTLARTSLDSVGKVVAE